MLACQAVSLGSIFRVGIGFGELFTYKSISMTKLLKKILTKNFFVLSRQCIYLQFKKSSDDISTHLAVILKMKKSNNLCVVSIQNVCWYVALFFCTLTT